MAFCDADEVPLLHRPFVRPGFEHCYAFTWSLGNSSTVIWPRVADLEIVTITRPPSFFVNHAIEEGHTVVSIRRERPEDIRVGAPLASFLTCSTLLAYTLGLDRSLIMSPYGLYQALLREGGRDLCPSSSNPSSQSSAARWTVVRRSLTALSSLRKGRRREPPGPRSAPAE